MNETSVRHIACHEKSNPSNAFSNRGMADDRVIPPSGDGVGIKRRNLPDIHLFKEQHASASALHPKKKKPKTMMSMMMMNDGDCSSNNKMTDLVDRVSRQWSETDASPAPKMSAALSRPSESNPTTDNKGSDQESSPKIKEEADDENAQGSEKEAEEKLSMLWTDNIAAACAATNEVAATPASSYSQNRQMFSQFNASSLFQNGFFQQHDNNDDDGLGGMAGADNVSLFLSTLMRKDSAGSSSNFSQSPEMTMLLMNQQQLQNPDGRLLAVQQLQQQNAELVKRNVTLTQELQSLKREVSNLLEYVIPKLEQQQDYQRESSALSSLASRFLSASSLQQLRQQAASNAAASAASSTSLDGSSGSTNHRPSLMRNLDPILADLYPSLLNKSSSPSSDGVPSSLQALLARRQQQEQQQKDDGGLFSRLHSMSSASDISRLLAASSSSNNMRGSHNNNNSFCFPRHDSWLGAGSGFGGI